MISDVKNITQLLQVNIKCKPEYEQNKFKITVYATALRLQDETEDSFDKPMILINPFFIIIGINNLALVSISIDTRVTCRRHATRAVRGVLLSQRNHLPGGNAGAWWPPPSDRPPHTGSTGGSA